MSSPERPRLMLLNLQFLRFVAATMVVLLHGANFYQEMGGNNAIFTSARSYGFAGVDIFFVLSGFILWTTNRATETTARIFRYIYRRLARIYLGYWPFLVLAWIARILWDPGGTDTVQTWESITLWPQRQAGQVLWVSWTLSYELYFYLSFFLLLFVRRRKLVVTACTLGLIAVNLHKHFVLDAFAPGNFQVIGAANRFLTSPWVLEFFMGLYVGMLAQRTTRFGKSALAVGLAILTGAAIAEAHGYATQTVFVNQALFGGGGAFVVYGLVAIEYRGTRILPRLSTLMGGASYTIYLSHTIIYRMLRGTGFVDAVRDSSVSPALVYVGVVLSILVVSAAFYTYFEAPLYERAKSAFKARDKAA